MSVPFSQRLARRSLDAKPAIDGGDAFFSSFYASPVGKGIVQEAVPETAAHVAKGTIAPPNDSLLKSRIRVSSTESLEWARVGVVNGTMSKGTRLRESLKYYSLESDDRKQFMTGLRSVFELWKLSNISNIFLCIDGTVWVRFFYSDSHEPLIVIANLSSRVRMVLSEYEVQLEFKHEVDKELGEIAYNTGMTMYSENAVRVSGEVQVFLAFNALCNYWGSSCSIYAGKPFQQASLVTPAIQVLSGVSNSTSSQPSNIIEINGIILPICYEAVLLLLGEVVGEFEARFWTISGCAGLRAPLHDEQEGGGTQEIGFSQVSDSDIESQAIDGETTLTVQRVKYSDALYYLK